MTEKPEARQSGMQPPAPPRSVDGSVGPRTPDLRSSALSSALTPVSEYWTPPEHPNERRGSGSQWRMTPDRAKARRFSGSSWRERRVASMFGESASGWRDGANGSREIGPLLPMQNRMSSATAPLVFDPSISTVAGDEQAIPSSPTVAGPETDQDLEPLAPIENANTIADDTGSSIVAPPDYSDTAFDTVTGPDNSVVAPARTLISSQASGLSDGAGPVETCGCSKGFHDDHIDSKELFVEDLNQAIKRMPPNRQQYARVKVLIVYWEESDLEELRTNAQRLGGVFKEQYEYEVDELVLENKSRVEDAVWVDFNTRLDRYLEDIGPVPQEPEASGPAAAQDLKPINLLILYYAGHGAMGREKSDTYVWQAKATPSCQLRWNYFTERVKRAGCDKFFIFDCCYALSMMSADQTWKHRCQLLAASGVNQVAAAPIDAKANVKKTKSRSSAGGFTEALIDTLTSADRPRIGMDTSLLHTIMWSEKCVKAFNLNPYPILKEYRPQAQSNIWLQSKKAKAMHDSGSEEHNDSAVSLLQQVDCLSNARMLVVIRLRNPTGDLNPQEWKDWLRKRPGSVGSMSVEFRTDLEANVKLEGVYSSDSSLLVVSMPLWVWNGMPQNSAYKEMGLIRGDNVVPSWLAADQSRAEAAAKISKARVRPAMSSIGETIEDDPYRSSPTLDFTSPVELLAEDPDVHSRRKAYAEDETAAVPRRTEGLRHGQKPSFAEPDGTVKRTAKLRDSETIHHPLREQAAAEALVRGTTYNSAPRLTQSKSQQRIHQELKRDVPNFEPVRRRLDGPIGSLEKSYAFVRQSHWPRILST